MFLTHTSFFCCCKLEASHIALSPEETESIKLSLFLKRDEFELRRRMCCPWSQLSNYLNSTVYLPPELPHLMSEHWGSLEWGLDVATVVIDNTIRAHRMYSTYPQPKSNPTLFFNQRHHPMDRLTGARLTLSMSFYQVCLTDNFPQTVNYTGTTRPFFFGAFILRIK